MTNYCFGIYYYIDKETGNIVYIGKDSHIDVEKRRRDHLNPSRYKSQPFNAVIQNNPERYEYKLYCHVDNIDELNQLEFDLINLYRPKFNFKHGGDGGIGLKKRNLEDFKYTVVKGGKGKDSKRTQQYCICNPYGRHLIQSIDRDYLVEIANKLNTGELTEDTIPKTKPFKYTIAKLGFKNGKQAYCILGQDYLSIISSIYFDKLIIVRDALNDGVVLESDVKDCFGINKVLELINYEDSAQTRIEELFR